MFLDGIASGAKAQRLFSATCGTLRLRSGQAIEAVPFQNFGHLVVFPQPVKPNIDLIGFIGPRPTLRVGFPSRALVTQPRESPPE
jgi:hypothetical protein